MVPALPALFSGWDGLIPDSFLNGAIDYAAVHKGRAMGAQEVADRWQIIQGQLNGSAYPEVGNGLGQYWAFLRLAEYFFVTGDDGAWSVLTNWLTWIDTYGAPDGSGWKIPTLFSEYGFIYGTYDPGMAASVALGCLWIYLRNGDARAGIWARRLLDDLRVNRWDPEFGGYMSDYHYAWLNALALRAFGIAAQGVVGQAYVFASRPEDREHFDALTAWVFAHAGDEKPNVLNADRIPFYYSEAADVWDNAPNYLAMRPDGYPGGGGGHGGCSPGARQEHRRLVLVAEPAGLYSGRPPGGVERRADSPSHPGL